MRYYARLKIVELTGTICLLRFMWRTGVRVSEVINVTPKDVEFKNGVVNIRKAKGGRQRRVLLTKKPSKCSPTMFEH